MTSLLRGSGERTQSVEWAARPADMRAPDPVIDNLERELTDLRATLASTQKEHEAELDAARLEGRESARAEFVRDDKARLDMLAKSLKAAASALDAKIERTEALALILCETALQNIFEDKTLYGELIARALQTQLNQLRREMVVAARVSQADFPNVSALQDIAASIRPHRIELDETLAAGACEIELKLGHIELSVPRYWADIKALLSAEAVAASPT